MMDDSYDPWGSVYGYRQFQPVADPIEGGGGFPDGSGSFEDPIVIDPIGVTVDGDEPVDDGGTSQQDDGGTSQQDDGQTDGGSTSEPADSSDDAGTGGGRTGIAVGDLVALAVIAAVTWLLVREL